MMVSKYHGLTYPWPCRWWWVQKLWKWIFCGKNKHLFDELWSPYEHYLHCDACGLIVHISDIELPKGKSNDQS